MPLLLVLRASGLLPMTTLGAIAVALPLSILLGWLSFRFDRAPGDRLEPAHASVRRQPGRGGAERPDRVSRLRGEAREQLAPVRHPRLPVSR